MTETQVRYIAQRGTDTQITQSEVDRAWADSVGAADLYERCSVDRIMTGGGVSRKAVDDARRRMLEATDYAERLQDAYNEQLDELEARQAKRVMMTSINGQVKLNPDWCKHEHIVDIMVGDDPGGSVWVCRDCGAYLNDDGTVSHIPTDEIEF